MKSVKGARLSVWPDRMLFLSDTQASESKLEVPAAGWEAAEVGETQLQKHQGGWTVKGTPALEVVPQERVCPIESKGQRSLASIISPSL